MKNLNSKVFKKAADLVPRPFKGCCAAIYTAEKLIHNKHDKKYIQFFEWTLKPENNFSLDFWYGHNTEDILARQLGLLLCAEVLKDEQKEKRK